MGEEGEGATLEYTPTWVLAAVCTVIVAISLAMERLLHYLGTVLKKKQQKPLFEALLKVKEGSPFLFSLYFFFSFFDGSVKGSLFFFSHILHFQKESFLFVYLSTVS